MKLPSAKNLQQVLCTGNYNLSWSGSDYNILNLTKQTGYKISHHK